MSIVVVGSVALDSVETPAGSVEAALGGSAVYFATAASFFQTVVRLVGVVGDDFDQVHVDFLRDRGVDLTGLERVAGGKTFHWKGHYLQDLNVAQTLATELNVFGDFQPKLPETYRDSDYLFLANIHPTLQLQVLRQMHAPRLKVCDTMNLWIETTRQELLQTIREIDVLILNDGEARQLTGESNLIRAAHAILALGPSRVVVKKGEHGAFTLTQDSFFAAPAYPLEQIVDPTGAGDTFAGGFMGYIVSAQDLSEQSFRKAILYGTVLASFNVQDFSLNRQRHLTYPEIEERFEKLAESMRI